jgi:hypothetical protein
LRVLWTRVSYLYPIALDETTHEIFENKKRRSSEDYYIISHNLKMVYEKKSHNNNRCTKSIPSAKAIYKDFCILFHLFLFILVFTWSSQRHLKKVCSHLPNLFCLFIQSQIKKRKVFFFFFQIFNPPPPRNGAICTHFVVWFENVIFLLVIHVL